MDLIACVAMAFGGGYIPVFFCTQQIIQRGKLCSSCVIRADHDVDFRVKLATIKYIGEYLCSTCIITKNQVRNIGTKLHDIVQSSKMRVDSISLQRKVQGMRQHIFERGQLVNGSVIDRGLPYSIIPVNVSALSY